MSGSHGNNNSGAGGGNTDFMIVDGAGHVDDDSDVIIVDESQFAEIQQMIASGGEVMLTGRDHNNSGTTVVTSSNHQRQQIRMPAQNPTPSLTSDHIKQLQSSMQMGTAASADAKKAIPDLTTQPHARLYKCSVCDALFKTEVSCSSHMKSAHSSTRTTRTTGTGAPAPAAAVGVTATTTTPISKPSTPSTPVTSADAKSDSQSQMQTALFAISKCTTKDEYDDVYYQCDRCPTRFTEKHKFMAHYFHHNGKGAFLCNLCDFKATTSRTIAKHVNCHYVEDEPEVPVPVPAPSVSTCQSAPTRPAPPPVSVATTVVPRPTHAIDTTFKCNVCPFETSVEKQMGYHQDGHHRDHGFHCRYCTFRSISRPFIDCHERLHEPQCDRTANSKSTLKTESEQPVKNVALYDSPSAPTKVVGIDTQLKPNPIKSKSTAVPKCTNSNNKAAVDLKKEEKIESNGTDEEQIEMKGAKVGTESGVGWKLRSVVKRKRTLACVVSSCKYRAVNRAQLMVHRDAKHPKYKSRTRVKTTPLNYHCSQCGLRFKRWAARKVHGLYLHAHWLRERGYSRVTVDPTVTLDTPNRPITVTKDAAIKRDASKATASVAASSCTTPAPATPQPQSQSTPVVPEYVQVAEGVYQCPYCPYVSTLQNTRTHVIGHQVKKTHSCDECTYSTDMQVVLEAHCRWHKTGVREQVIAKAAMQHKKLSPKHCVKQKSPMKPATVLPTKPKQRRKSPIVISPDRSKLAVWTPKPKKNQKRKSALPVDEEPSAKTRVDNIPKAENLPPLDPVEVATMPFKCSKCPFRSHKQSALLAHDLCHTTEHRYKCSQCCYSSSHRYTNIQHELWHRLDVKPVPSGQKVIDGDLEVNGHKIGNVWHFADEPNRQYFRCAQCPMETKAHSGLVHHSRQHSCANLPYKCVQCSYGVSLPTLLHVHAAVHQPSYMGVKHPNKQTNSNAVQVHAIGNVDTKQVESSVTEGGEKTEMETVDNDVPVNKDQSMQVSVQDSNKQPPLMLVRSPSTRRGGFKCRVCQFQAKDINEYQRHRRYFHKSAPSRPIRRNAVKHFCDACVRGFRSQAAYELHVQHEHKGQAPPQLNKLANNAVSSHAQVSPASGSQESSGSVPSMHYQCPYCPFGTESRSTFRVHRKMHGHPLRQYACPLCDYSSSIGAALKRHLVCHGVQSQANTTHRNQLNMSGRKQRERAKSKRLLQNEGEDTKPVLKCSSCATCTHNVDEYIEHLIEHARVHDREKRRAIKTAAMKKCRPVLGRRLQGQVPGVMIGDNANTDIELNGPQIEQLPIDNVEHLLVRNNQSQGGKLYCSKCSFECADLDVFSTHQAMHCAGHRSVTDHLQCAVCDYVTLSENVLRFHEQNHHTNVPFCLLSCNDHTVRVHQKYTSTAKATKSAPSEMEPMASSRMQCSLCSFECVEPILLRTHWAEQHSQLTNQHSALHKDSGPDTKIVVNGGLEDSSEELDEDQTTNDRAFLLWLNLKYVE